VTPRGEARHRPELKLPLTPIDWLLIFLGILSVGFLVVLWVLTWPKVPEHIPEDFPAMLNRRRELLILPILGLKLYIIMLAFTAVPSDYNHPWRITPDNAEFSYRLMRRFVLLVAAIIPWIPFVFYLRIVQQLIRMTS
jgi:hypothetical protein